MKIDLTSLVGGARQSHDHIHRYRLTVLCLRLSIDHALLTRPWIHYITCMEFMSTPHFCCAGLQDIPLVLWYLHQGYLADQTLIYQ